MYLCAHTVQFRRKSTGLFLDGKIFPCANTVFYENKKKSFRTVSETLYSI